MSFNAAQASGPTKDILTEAITTINGSSVASQDVQFAASIFRTSSGTCWYGATGSGAVTLGVQRVTLASDDTAVTNLTSTKNSLITLAAAVSSNRIQADINSSALPSGAATSAKQDSQTTLLTALAGGLEYERVAASATTQALGASGALGDVLESLLIVPATTSPGAVMIRDGSAGTDMVVFTGGASSVSNLVPFTIALGYTSVAAGGWRVTTGSNVSVIAGGQFT